MKAFKLIMWVSLFAGVLALAVTHDGVIGFASTHLADYLGLMTAETCEAQVVP